MLMWIFSINSYFKKLKNGIIWWFKIELNKAITKHNKAAATAAPIGHGPLASSSLANSSSSTVSSTLSLAKGVMPKLTKTDEMEWMEVFETKKAEAQTLKAEIGKTDKEIDQMVYESYGLTAAEIAIVENSSN